MRSYLNIVIEAPCEQTSNVLLIVYQMGRLCGGAHEISGIKAPIFLHGWVVGVGDWVAGGGVVVVGCGVGGGGIEVVGWGW